MDSADLARALEFVNEERVVDLLCRLIDTPSPTGHEVECAETLADFLRSHGVPANVQRFHGSRANVISRLAGKGSGIGLMFCGHLDTTGTGDPKEDYPAFGELGPGDLAASFVEDGIVHGLGAYNMKGGIAAAAEALIALAKAGVELNGEVSLGAVAGESEKAPVLGALRDFDGPAGEGGGVGAAWLLRHTNRPDAVLICEPSNLFVINAQSGYLQVKITVLGRAAYQASKGPNFPGLNAIDLAWNVIAALREWEPVYRERTRLECGMGTMFSHPTVGAIEGGWPHMPAIIPAVCNLYVDLRVPPHIDPHSALRDLDEVVRLALAATPTARYIVEVVASNVPGVVTPLAHPLVQAGLDARRAVLDDLQGRHPDEDLAAGDDGKLFAGLGIPFIRCGPSGLPKPGQTRHGNEWVEVRQLVQASRIYVSLAVDIAERDRSSIENWPASKMYPQDFSGHE